jgi:predicted nucleotidyltransferase
MAIVKEVEKTLKKLNYKFTSPPILVGGWAMEYYNLRKTGHDFDLLISNKDKVNLMKNKEKYKNMGFKLNKFGGVTCEDIDCTLNFTKINLDLIITIYQHKYSFFTKGAISVGSIKIVSLENLLLLKTLAVFSPGSPIKHRKDVKLIIEGIYRKQYPKLKEYPKVKMFDLK